MHTIIEIWDIATVELVGGTSYIDSPVTSLALHPDETQLVAGTEEGQIELLVPTDMTIQLG